MGLTARIILAGAGLAMLAGLMGCAHGGALNREKSLILPPNLKPGDFFQANATLEPAQAAESAARAGYVLVGEAHLSICDHQTQAQIIEVLAQTGAKPAVGLEMVSLERQPVLDRFNQGEIEPKDLEQALNWQKTWGFPFVLYLPVFQAAKAHGLPVYALNPPLELAHKVGQTGLDSLDPDERRGLPDKLIPALDQEKAQLRQAFKVHPALSSPGEKGRDWKSFLDVQAFWNTTMAYRARQIRRELGCPVIILAGGGHVGRDMGIAARLAVLDPETSRLVFAPARSSQTDLDEADIFFFCPDSGHARLGLKLEAGTQALTVAEVEPDSKAQAAGFLAGDRLLAAGGHPLNTLADLHQAAAEAAMAGKGLAMEISRAGQTQVLTVPLGARTK